MSQFGVRSSVAGLRDVLAWTLGTFFGTGRFPVAPGTVGSAAALVVPLLLPDERYLLTVVILTIIATIVGVPVAERLERISGGHDPGFFVLDEVAGMWLTVMALEKPSVPVMIAAFVAFRIFDVLKPWPANRLDRDLPGGWGVMLDDVAAGMMAWAALWLARAALAALGITA